MSKVLKILLATILIPAVISTGVANAKPVVGFQAGHIIDDLVFINKNSMNVDQIQAFLSSKVPVCDNWGTNGSTSTSRRDFVLSHGYTLPMTCLKDYTENGLSSAQIIYNASQTYNINPQVLIVLLQKEQGLVTDDWPTDNQYRAATGYGCPDTAPCDSQYYGLTNQINWAAHMFRAIFNSSPTWYTPYILGNNYIQYTTNASCGGTVVYIENKATQSLYNYTPYQPNQSALNAGYGAGDSCSSHGNRNFYQYFVDWFGSTRFIQDPNNNVVLSGDFNSDSNTEIATFYAYNSNTAMIIDRHVTNSSNILSVPEISWTSRSGDWESSRTKLVSGDFNADGKTDIAALYDYGNGQIGWWIFYGTVDGLASPVKVYETNPSNWESSRTKLVSGDFNADGKTDIAALYDYGNGQIGWWIFYGTVDGLAPPTALTTY